MDPLKIAVGAEVSGLLAFNQLDISTMSFPDAITSRRNRLGADELDYISGVSRGDLPYLRVQLGDPNGAFLYLIRME
jgi:hypothetical protein